MARGIFGRRGAPPRAGAVAAPPPGAPTTAAGQHPASGVPWSLRVGAEYAWRLLVFAAALYVLLIPVRAVRLVVFAVAAALLLAALLSPLVRALRGLGLPRALAAALAFLGGLAAIVGVGYFIGDQFAANFATLTVNVQDGVRQVREWLAVGPLHLSDAQIRSFSQQVIDSLARNRDKLASAGVTTATVAVEVVSGTLVALFTTYFFLYDGERIWRWVVRLFPRGAESPVAGAGERAWVTLTAYVRGIIVVAFVDAVFIGIGIAVLGVPLAVPLAALVFLGAFVPLVGATLTGAVAVLVALVAKGFVTAVLVLVIIIAVQQIEGHLLQPLILGRAVSVHPLAVVLAVASGAILAGIGGALVAVPLVAVINTVVSYLVRERAAAAPPGARAP